MDSNTGEIFRLGPLGMSKLEKQRGRPMVPLTEEQADKLEPMGARQRKGYMRNQPCICGSGIKFKRCCWSKFK